MYLKENCEQAAQNGVQNGTNGEAARQKPAFSARGSERAARSGGLCRRDWCVAERRAILRRPGFQELSRRRGRREQIRVFVSGYVHSYGVSFLDLVPRPAISGSEGGLVKQCKVPPNR